MHKNLRLARVLVTLQSIYFLNPVVAAIIPNLIEATNSNDDSYSVAYSFNFIEPSYASPYLNISNKEANEKARHNTAPIEININGAESPSLEQNTIAPSSDITISQHYSPQSESNEVHTATATYSGGQGTEEYPYLIKDAYDLITLSNTPSHWSKNFYQIDDISFTTPSEFNGNTIIWSDADANGSVSFDEIDFNMDGVFTNDTLGFSPIGNQIKNFSGNYKGRNVNTNTDQSYLIDHLYINRTSTDSVGLFGASSNDTKIGFIEFTNGYVSGRYYVGMCSGAGPSSLLRIQTGGTVIGRKRVGGVIGSLEEGYGSIKECGNSATIINNGTSADSNGGQHTGGIAGYIKRNIKNCYNTGYVYSPRTNGGNTGGISGTITSSMSYCYSSGAVSGRANVGGITGQNQGAITQLSATGYVFGINDTITGAISGAKKANITNVVYDTTTVNQDFPVGIKYISSSIRLNTSDFNTQTSFPFSFGNSETAPWKINSNTHGRPYLYWQDASVSNPFPKYTSLGFDTDATYTGILQTQNPVTPEITNKGVRITKVNSNGEASWNGIDWEWHHIYADSISSTTFTTIQENILNEDDEFMVQSFVINANGQMRYGDMVKMKARHLLSVITHNDSERSTTSTTLNGEIIIGSNITEYGVLYSRDIDTMTLDDLNTNPPIVKKVSEITSTDTDANALTPFNFSIPLAIGDLVNRSGYYTRAYAKDESGSVAYGDIKRFITEKRDFSLHLDGSSALLVDVTSTSNYINDWSSSGTDQFSIDFWIKNEDGLSSEQTILHNHNSTSGYAVTLGTDGKIYLKSHNGNTVNTDSTITDDLWHHVAITYNGANSAAATLYLDGIVASKNILLVKPDIQSTKLCIGTELNNTALTKTFTGKLDALRFWNTPLSNEQVLKLAYDNIQASANNNVELRGSGIEITDLAWENLTAAIGFNVKSTFEANNTTTPTSYENEGEGYDYPFFAEEGRQRFNIIAIGAPRPSNYLPRTNWSFTATNNSWLTDSNWSSSAFPGQGIHSSELSVYTDITNNEILSSGEFCQYTIINKVDDNLYTKPLVNSSPPFIHYLVDYDKEYESYRVDDNDAAQLTIKGGIIADLFESESGIITDGELFLIESGSIEVE